MNEITNLLTEDAKRIRYLLEITLQYTQEIGPRDLRDHEDKFIEFINKLPSQDF